MIVCHLNIQSIKIIRVEKLHTSIFLPFSFSFFFFFLILSANVRVEVSKKKKLFNAIPQWNSGRETIIFALLSSHAKIRKISKLICSMEGGFNNIFLPWIELRKLKMLRWLYDSRNRRENFREISQRNSVAETIAQTFDTSKGVGLTRNASAASAIVYNAQISW